MPIAADFQPPTAQLDDYSDEGGSPNMKDKRVKANRLSAQRSRQRKLEKEAQLTQDVEKLSREVAAEQHREHVLISEENGELPAIPMVGRWRPERCAGGLQGEWVAW
jgi:hypothetical protein